MDLKHENTAMKDNAGAARIDITPPLGTILDVDYVPHYARFIHDPLYVKALVFRDEYLTITIVDICIMGTDFMDDVKSQIYKKTGIHPKNILLASNHDHAAGNVVGLLGGAVDIDYRRKLPRWIVQSVNDAKAMVLKNYNDTASFNAPYGVRTLSKYEKMYDVRATGNPSNWLGPIWIVSNYITFRGLVKYGYNAEAKLLAEKTIRLIGNDFKKYGALHEYYLPESGEPVLNKGFQNWNYLVLNIIAWYEGKPIVTEF